MANDSKILFLLIVCIKIDNTIYVLIETEELKVKVPIICSMFDFHHSRFHITAQS